MCGFVSIVTDETYNLSISSTLNKMTEIIKHRGPDECRTWEDDHIYLGFQRLSIIDLEKGHQPFSFDGGDYHIVFNGEIYNYIELRQKLIDMGIVLTTKSDTEVIIALYKEVGSQVVEYLRGMFSFVIWNKKANTLFGARDPFGIKPFYYIEENDRLYCASEKKSLMLIDGVSFEIDQESLHHYLTFQYVPEPKTLLNPISILKPGHTIEKKLGEKCIINEYANMQFKLTKDSTAAKIKIIRETLEDSVSMHMRSDVPVGTFLSGGIDSTIIAALAKEINPDIKAFTVGFERDGYSEIPLAQETASQMNLNHFCKIITPEEFMNELPKITWHMDGPVADPAAIPLYFVAREAKKHVKVVLSGEGADEIFGGYNIYREPNSLRIFDYMPNSIKKILKNAFSRLSEGTKGKSFVYRGCTPLVERYFGNAHIFNEQEKEFILQVYNPNFSSDLITKPFYREAELYDDITKMQYIDMHTWLRGDILVKADRMTMANSLEARVPFLDKEVIKIGSQLTVNEKIRNKTTKYLLREAFKDTIPEPTKNRVKLGFPVPIKHWLKSEMYDWAKTIIKESDTNQYINKENSLNMLEKHRKGEIDYSRRLWTIIIFMLWHQIFVEQKYNFNVNTIDFKPKLQGKKVS
ncbi:asparagine synthase (glutamine-hydrolyzing) [Alkalibaculum sp. M08DMB]|uniref:asparagine synthase (glutamine-hydrolyzing) n=1 Tax=Alkalibaculum sporogenes TaxID=2655001 RepID=A0A6A7K4M6_9FIRM|nr:asparagine synthase (glutamine-hydrolyzing) [Alkalibaculum sporogenes]MPW24416.1 asparagine synthase (glutamine-hydrolyzing) [Alkalibaculum sporogenes]